MKKIECFEECRFCAGTGLFTGYAERNGFAVVCRVCGGTGQYHFEYNYKEFTGRKTKKGIKRVLKVNPGIGVGINKEKKLTYESFGGMPYKDWKAGSPFPKKSEMREYTCPCWWYQSADFKLKPNWKECNIINSFSSCKNFYKKEKCWEKFDKQHSGIKKKKEK